MDRHREFLRRTPGGRLVLAEKSGHYIQRDEPELVISAARLMVESVRQKARRP